MEILKKCKRLSCFLLAPILIDGISEMLFHFRPFEGYFIDWLLVGEGHHAGNKVIFNHTFNGGLLILLSILPCVASCLNKDENSFKYTIKKPAINIDYISENDKGWIDEIKQRYNNGEKLIAYSSKGAFSAREKAIVLGIYEYFDDFLSQEEFKMLREK